MKLVHNPNAPRWRGLKTDQADFTVQFVPSSQVVDPIVEQFVDRDVIKQRETGQTTLTAYSVTASQSLSFGPVELTNLTPAVYNLSGSLATATTFSSVGRLRAKGRAGVREYDLRFPDAQPIVTVRDHALVPGTLAAHCTDNVLQRLSGKSQGGLAQNVFQESFHGYTLETLSCTGYNQSSIVAGLDLACVQFASSRQQFSSGLASEHRLPSLLAGPRHLIGAWHAMNEAGQRVFFRRNDGSFAEAVVLQLVHMGNDLGLATLDRDITGIQFARTLPRTWTQKMQATYRVDDTVPRDPLVLAIGLTGNTSPGLGFVRHAQVFGLRGMGHLDSSPQTHGANRSVSFTRPKDQSLAPWYSEPYGGDSNSPLFLIIQQGASQVPAFISNFFTAFSGPHHGAHELVINQQLTAMSAAAGDTRPFTLQTVDLSAFPDVA